MENWQERFNEVSAKRQEIEDLSYQLMTDSIKTFMGKFKTDHIHFDVWGDNYPSLLLRVLDDNDHEFNVFKMRFNEDGTIKSICGHDFYMDDDGWDLPTDEFVFIEDFYEEIAKCVVAQIENGIYLEEDEDD